MLYLQLLIYVYIVYIDIRRYNLAQSSMIVSVFFFVPMFSRVSAPERFIGSVKQKLAAWAGYKGDKRTIERLKNGPHLSKAGKKDQ